MKNKKPQESKLKKQTGKLRILAIGDIHGDSSRTKKIAEKAKKSNIDLIILAGDILSPIKTKNLIKPLKDIKKDILILPGNHETFEEIDFLSKIYNMKNLHSYALKQNNIGFFGAGGAIEFNTTEKEIMEVLKKGHNHIKNMKKKIMITHMHPKDSKSEFSGIPGSKSIKKAINTFKPDFLIHAHIHEGEGLEEKIGKTKIINVGRKGKIIEI
jgi:uncharacterized protein